MRLHQPEGGGWAHYVGQKSCAQRPAGLPLAFAAGLAAPARQDEQHQLLLCHTDQWRYETLGMDEIVSPLATKSLWGA